MSFFFLNKNYVFWEFFLCKLWKSGEKKEITFVEANAQYLREVIFTKILFFWTTLFLKCSEKYHYTGCSLKFIPLLLFRIIKNIIIKVVSRYSKMTMLYLMKFLTVRRVTIRGVSIFVSKMVKAQNVLDNVLLNNCRNLLKNINIQAAH